MHQSQKRDRSRQFRTATSYGGSGVRTILAFRQAERDFSTKPTLDQQLASVLRYRSFACECIANVCEQSGVGTLAEPPLAAKQDNNKTAIHDSPDGCERCQR